MGAYGGWGQEIRGVAQRGRGVPEKSQGEVRVSEGSEVVGRVFLLGGEARFTTGGFARSRVSHMPGEEKRFSLREGKAYAVNAVWVGTST